MKFYADLHPTRQVALFSPAGMTKKKEEIETVGQTDRQTYEISGYINLNPRGGGMKI
jgi:hypothetical protein